MWPNLSFQVFYCLWNNVRKIMFLRGEEIHMLQGIKRTPETIEISGVSVRETGLEIVVVWFSSLLHIPRSFYINAFTFLDIPRFSYPIPNGEGFLRDFVTLINPIALAILTSGFLIQGWIGKPAIHSGLPEGISDGN